jgi:cell division protein FtsB
MRTVMLMLVMTFFGLQYKLWLGEAGIIEYRALEKKIQIKKEANKQAWRKNQQLEAIILALHNGAESVLEGQARYELGLVKRGELYYQFVE